MSVTQRGQERDHVLDLGGAEHGLAAEGGSDPREAVGSMIRRHDRRRVHARGIDHPEPDLALGEPAADASQVGREIALEALLGERPAVTEEAQPRLTVDDDRPPARGIAAGAGERIGQGILGTRRIRQRAQDPERDGREAEARTPDDRAGADEIRDPPAAASSPALAAAGVARTATPSGYRGS